MNLESITLSVERFEVGSGRQMQVARKLNADKLMRGLYSPKEQLWEELGKLRKALDEREIEFAATRNQKRL